jgi:hypothetical protein
MKKRSLDLCDKDTKVMRYPGSDVPGMEYTTARPMAYETGANPKVPMPGKPWPKSLCHSSTTEGKG